MTNDDQSWFWTDWWQAGEREADASPESPAFDSADELLKHIWRKYGVKPPDEAENHTLEGGKTHD